MEEAVAPLEPACPAVQAWRARKLALEILMAGLVLGVETERRAEVTLVLTVHLEKIVPTLALAKTV